MTTDPNSIAAQVVQLITPFIPYLIKGSVDAGKIAVEKLGKVSIEKGLEKAEAIWDKIKNKKDVEKAAELVIQAPNDVSAQTVLRLQIELTLTNDMKLLELIEELLKGSADEKNVVIAKGSRSVSIGGNVSGSNIITGDNNRIDK